MVTLNDYQQGEMLSEGQGIEQLQKAMVAGQTTGRDTTGLALTQEPLKVESLEKTLKNLEYRTQDIRLFNAIPKLTAYNTVEEFIQLSSYGSQRGGFYREGELSDVEDSTYIRKSELIKYIQVTGEVTMQAQMVRSYVDAMRQETENKMKWIMRTADIALTKGDSNVVSEEFNSLYKQHASIGVGDGFHFSTFEAYYNSNTVIDLRGKSLTQAGVETGAVDVDSNYGAVDSLFAPTTVISQLTKDYIAQQRILQNGTGFTGTIGTGGIKAISTTIGDVNLMSDKFMKADAPRLLTDGATSSKAPSAPGTVDAALVADSTSKLGTGSGETGAVYYAVSAINRYGESALTHDATPVTLAAAFSVDVNIVSGSTAGSGYMIYRTKPGATTTDYFYPIFKISNAELAAGFHGAAAAHARDKHYFLPAMEQCFLTEMSEEVMALKQLAPMSKLDLAVLSMSRRFITFLFCTPQLFAPKKMVRFINVAPTYNPPA